MRAAGEGRDGDHGPGLHAALPPGGAQGTRARRSGHAGALAAGARGRALGAGGAQGAEGGGGPRLGAFSRLIGVCVRVSVCVCVRPSAVLRGVQGEVPYLRALRAEAG